MKVGDPLVEVKRKAVNSGCVVNPGRDGTPIATRA
jgi:hypothetical protein